MTGTCIIIATQYDPRVHRERRASSQTAAQLTRSQERLWLTGSSCSASSDTARSRQITSIGDKYRSTSTMNLTSPRASDASPAPPGFEARGPASVAFGNAVEGSAVACSSSGETSEPLASDLAPLQALAYEVTFVIDALGAERSRVTLYSREDVRGKSVGWYERQWALECCRLLIALKDSFHVGAKAANASVPTTPSGVR